MRRIGFLVVGLAWSAWGQSITVHSDSRSQRIELEGSPQPPVPGDDFQLSFEASPDRVTTMRVLSPEGARAEVWDGATLVTRGDLPLSFTARAERSYRFRVTLTGGQVWERTVAARRNQTGTLRVSTESTERAPDGQQALPEAAFSRLQEAIEAESLPQQKWAVLQAALGGGARFTVAQVGLLVELFDTPRQRLGVVEICRARIVDRKNLFQLYFHFDTEAEKQKLHALLGP